MGDLKLFHLGKQDKLRYLKLIEKVGAGRAGYVNVVMPVLALIISTIFENLEWQYDLIMGLPILIIGAVLVINQKIRTN